MPIESPWLNTAEAANYSRRHLNTISKALRTGELTGNQTCRGGTWLINREHLDAWIRGEIADVKVPVVTRRRAS